MRFWLAVAFVEPDQLVELARAAEAAGYHGILVSDHMFYPRDLRSPYPYTRDGRPIWSLESPWPDPWCAISAMAAVTSTLRFGTNVFVAPARNVYTVAKLVGTAAVLSGGRVVLGVGAGWMQEEFRAHGQDFATRGRRLDEMIGVLRQVWAGGGEAEWVEHHGEHYDVPAMRMNPRPAQPVPIWAGGASPAALRRAAALCDGWIAEGVRAPDELAGVARDLRARLVGAGRGGKAEDVDVVGAVRARPAVELFRRLRDDGVTGVICAPWMATAPSANGATGPLSEKVSALERYAEEIVSRV